MVISMTFNRLVFSCVFVRLVIIDVVSIVDTVSWISPMVFDGHSCDGLRSQVGPWFQSLCLEMTALASTPLVMMSAGFDVVGQNLHALGQVISLIRRTRCLINCCRRALVLDIQDTVIWESLKNFLKWLEVL